MMQLSFSMTYLFSQFTLAYFKILSCSYHVSLTILFRHVPQTFMWIHPFICLFDPYLAQFSPPSVSSVRDPPSRGSVHYETSVKLGIWHWLDIELSQTLAVSPAVFKLSTKLSNEYWTHCFLGHLPRMYKKK